MKATWIAYRGNLLEGRRRIRRISAGAENAVSGDPIHSVGKIEPLRDRRQMKVFRERESPAEPRAQIEEIKTGTGVARDEDSVNRRASCRPLNGVCTGRDVERQRRVVAQHRSKLETMGKSFPDRMARRQGAVDVAIEG